MKSKRCSHSSSFIRLIIWLFFCKTWNCFSFLLHSTRAFSHIVRRWHNTTHDNKYVLDEMWGESVEWRGGSPVSLRHSLNLFMDLSGCCIQVYEIKTQAGDVMIVSNKKGTHLPLVFDTATAFRLLNVQDFAWLLWPIGTNEKSWNE